MIVKKFCNGRERRSMQIANGCRTAATPQTRDGSGGQSREDSGHSDTPAAICRSVSSNSAPWAATTSGSRPCLMSLGHGNLPEAT
jgi:hypothetical protein